MTIELVSPDNFGQLEALFGPRGGLGGCWCLWWHQRGKEYDQNKGETNHGLLREMVEREEKLGAIAFDNGKPVGWCSFGPKDSFKRLKHSRNFGGDEPFLSIICFFIDKDSRRKGIAFELLNWVSDWARKKGFRTLEAYPIDSPNPNYPPAFAHTGFLSMFLKNGFEEVERPSPTRPLVRKILS